MITFIQ